MSAGFHQLADISPHFFFPAERVMNKHWQGQFFPVYQYRLWLAKFWSPHGSTTYIVAASRARDIFPDHPLHLPSNIIKSLEPPDDMNILELATVQINIQTTLQV